MTTKDRLRAIALKAPDMPIVAYLLRKNDDEFYENTFRHTLEVLIRIKDKYRLDFGEDKMMIDEKLKLAARKITELIIARYPKYLLNTNGMADLNNKIFFYLAKNGFQQYPQSINEVTDEIFSYLFRMKIPMPGKLTADHIKVGQTWAVWIDNEEIELFTIQEIQEDKEMFEALDIATGEKYSYKIGILVREYNRGNALCYGTKKRQIPATIDIDVANRIKEHAFRFAEALTKTLPRQDYRSAENAIAAYVQYYKEYQGEYKVLPFYIFKNDKRLLNTREKKEIALQLWIYTFIFYMKYEKHLTFIKELFDDFDRNIHQLFNYEIYVDIDKYLKPI